MVKIFFIYIFIYLGSCQLFAEIKRFENANASDWGFSKYDVDSIKSLGNCNPDLLEKLGKNILNDQFLYEKYESKGKPYIIIESYTTNGFAFQGKLLESDMERYENFDLGKSYDRIILPEAYFQQLSSFAMEVTRNENSCDLSSLFQFGPIMDAPYLIFTYFDGKVSKTSYFASMDRFISLTPEKVLLLDNSEKWTDMKAATALVNFWKLAVENKVKELEYILSIVSTPEEIKNKIGIK